MGSSWDKRLVEGKEAEERVKSLLRPKPGAIILDTPEDVEGRQDFEMLYNGHAFRVEVKNEDKKVSTGNICVEMCQGVPLMRVSGILASEATVWIHTLQDECVVYRKLAMLRYCLNKVKKGTELRKFGDGGRCRGLIFTLGERTFQRLELFGH